MTNNLTVRPTSDEIYIRKGDTFYYPYTITDDADAPLDLTEYEAKIQIRKSQISDSELILEMNSTAGSPYITLGDTTNNFVIEVPLAVVDELAVGEYFFDWKMKDTNDRTSTWVQGKVIVDNKIST
jgi:hypothetical protein